MAVQPPAISHWPHFPEGSSPLPCLSAFCHVNPLLHLYPSFLGIPLTSSIFSVSWSPLSARYPQKLNFHFHLIQDTLVHHPDAYISMVIDSKVLLNKRPLTPYLTLRSPEQLSELQTHFLLVPENYIFSVQLIEIMSPPPP